MRSKTKVLVGISIIAVVAFIFLVPVFFSGINYGPTIITGGPVYTTYQSLSCKYLGIGDTYINPGPTFSAYSHSWAPMNQGMVFSCTDGPFLGW